MNARFNFYLISELMDRVAGKGLAEFDRDEIMREE
jgi:hypothetical protein